MNWHNSLLWLGVNKVLQKITKSYKNELRHLFQWCILIPRKCLRKTPFQHTVRGIRNPELKKRKKNANTKLLIYLPMYVYCFIWYPKVLCRVPADHLAIVQGPSSCFLCPNFRSYWKNNRNKTTFPMSVLRVFFPTKKHSKF